MYSDLTHTNSGSFFNSDFLKMNSFLQFSRIYVRLMLNYLRVDDDYEEM